MDSREVRLSLETSRLKLNVYLRIFFAKKKFGQIFPGMDRNEVLTILGKPPHWEGMGSVSYLDSEIWSYPKFRLQLNLSSEVLTIMCHGDFIYADASMSKDFSFADAGIELIHDWTIFRAWLIHHELPFTEKLTRFQILFTSSSGVAARFSNRPDECNKKLIGIRASIGAEVPPWI